jgi:hypothetical protein
MPSEKTIGAAPLIAGIVLASQSAQAIVQSGLSLWSVPAFIGGCAAILIGLGILLDWDVFNQEPSESSQTSATVLGVALLAGLAGATVAVL